MTDGLEGHLLNWQTTATGAWDWCLERALAYGDGRLARYGTVGRKRQVGLVFFNDSLRTRASMEVAAHQLGAYPLVVTPGSGTWGFAWERGTPMTGMEAEHITEAIAVLSRYVDLLGVRLFASGTDLDADRNDARLKTIIEASGVPVVNLESAFWHPCQALADAAVVTRESRRKEPSERPKFVLTWAPHPKPLPTAVPNSALLMAVRLGLDVTLVHPEGFDLDASVMDEARRQAGISGGTLDVAKEQAAAFDGASFVYAKAWGGLDRYENPEAEIARRAAHGDWTVTRTLMARTDGGRFMHCLPVRRGVVVEDAVLDDPRSLHLEQAEFRLHAQKAILEWFWGAASDSSADDSTAAELGRAARSFAQEIGGAARSLAEEIRNATRPDSPDS